MAQRATWKGFLKIGELLCPVGLYSVVSQSARVAFHTLNRATGHRVRRQYVDRETGRPVEAGDQVKGYEIAPSTYVMIEPDEIAAAMPENDKTLSADMFISCGEIDDLYFDRPYYLAPADPAAGPIFALIAETLHRQKVAALVRTVLFRRLRTVLIQAHGPGLIATTLKFNYEVRPADEVLGSTPQKKVDREMLDLARHIIETKRGTFDPTSFADRYEAALADLVKAKIEGRPLPRPKTLKTTPKTDLLAALRKSAAGSGRTKAKPARKAS
jgi:DNA end-binding protein Ku